MKLIKISIEVKFDLCFLEALRPCRQYSLCIVVSISCSEAANEMRKKRRHEKDKRSRTKKGWAEKYGLVGATCAIGSSTPPPASLDASSPAKPSYLQQHEPTMDLRRSSASGDTQELGDDEEHELGEESKESDDNLAPVQPCRSGPSSWESFPVYVQAFVRDSRFRQQFHNKWRVPQISKHEFGQLSQIHDRLRRRAGRYSVLYKQIRDAID